MALEQTSADPSTASHPRPPRADAARNRQRLLDAAREVFRERGIEAGVGEVAERAGVGRATLFRNFPTKQDLIVAVVAERIREGIEEGRELLASGSDEELLFPFVSKLVGNQQLDRALFEVVAEEDFMDNEVLCDAHDAIGEVLDGLIAHDVERGYVREGVGAMDVLMLFKGACAAAAAMSEMGLQGLERHLSFVRAALAAPGRDCPLEGSTPQLADLQRRSGS